MEFFFMQIKKLTPSSVNMSRNNETTNGTIFRKKCLANILSPFTEISSSVTCIHERRFRFFVRYAKEDFDSDDLELG